MKKVSANQVLLDVHGQSAIGGGRHERKSQLCVLAGIFLAGAAGAQIVPPDDLSRTSYTPTPRAIALSWDDNSNNETHFNIQLSADGGTNWSALGQVGSGTTTFSGTLPAGNGMLFFRVLATDGTNFSSPSNIISVEGTDPGIADTDSDGMNDAFEVLHGLDAYYDDAYEDADGDRYPNIFEYSRGSDPSDLESGPIADYIADAGVTPSGNVFATIQGALDQVSADYRIILVRDGLYSGSGNVNLTVSGSHSVLILGENGARDSAIDGGGTARLINTSGNVILDGLTFRHGAATEGGAVYSSEGELFVINCVFSGNYAVQNGGAIYQEAGNTLVIHSTFVGNTAGDDGASIFVESGGASFAKSILWNTGAVSELATGGTTASVSVVQSIVRGGYSGTGNLNSDPLARADGHLLAGSPAIDSGGIFVTAMLDMDGEERPVGTTTDIGADEWLDTDTDGLPDWWEIYHIGSLSAGSAGHSDSDSLTNAEEYALDLIPDNPDSDGDGMDDGWEVDNDLDPRANDAAGDADGDGYSNLTEYQRGLDPQEDNVEAQLAGGWGHTLALRMDGKVWSVGNNSDGQLGDGSTTERNAPVEVSGLSHIVGIAAGTKHSAAVKSDGAVWTWGKGNEGQLGNGANSNATTPVQASGTGFIRVSAGDGHTLALKNDGTVWAWGRNIYGQLGTSGTTGSNTPVAVVGVGGSGTLTGVVAISAGHSFNLALKSDGTIVSWGRNDKGQLGDGTTTNRLSPVVVSGTAFTAIAAGAAHSLALKSDGTVKSWGGNNVGQLGNSSASDPSTSPVTVNGVSSVTSIAAGDSHSLFLKNDGTVRSSGYGAMGQLGNGTTASQWSVVTVSDVDTVSKISAGSVCNHSLEVLPDGRFVVWGDNRTNQLGDRAALVNPSPLVVSNIDGVVDVAMTMDESHFALVRRTDGYVWALGSNDSGQLGLGNYLDAQTPIRVKGEGGFGRLQNVVQLGAADRFSVARKSDGTIRAWGYGGYGTLGQGTSGWSNVPIVTGTSLSGVIDLENAGLNAVALKSDGSVWTWGINWWGQLGDGTTTNRNAPVQVVGSGSSGYLLDIEEVSIGSTHVIARKSDGTVWSWGRNFFGQLGDGTSTDRATPVQVLGQSGTGTLTNVVNIVAGGRSNLAFKDDGTLWTWGQDFPTPRRMPGAGGSGYLADVVEGDGGQMHVVLRKSDKSVWTCGLNWGGQLGNGTTTDSLANPVQVSGVRGVTRVFAGQGSTMALKEDGTLYGWGESRGNDFGAGIADRRVTGGVMAALHAWHVAPTLTLSVSSTTPAVLWSNRTLSISPAGGSGSIAKVEFYNERVLVGEVYSAPWSYEWQAQTWGTYHITAVAVDSNGNRSNRSNVVTLDVPYDSEDGTGDGLPDWWEYYWIGSLEYSPTDDLDLDGMSNLAEYQQGSEPWDYYSQGPNQIVPVITIVSGDGQTGDAATFTEEPMVVLVTDGTNPLVNAPLNFSVTGTAGGAIARDATGTDLSSWLYATTGTDGRASVYYRLPDEWQRTGEVSADAWSDTGSSHVAFTATSGTIPFSGVSLWLRADAGVSKDESGYVSGWTDVSGSENHGAQGTGSSQPQLIENVFNGKPVVRFDGSNDFISSGTNPSLVSEDFTYFVVSSFSGTTGNMALLSRDQGAGTENKWIYWYTGGGLQFHIYPGFESLNSTSFTRTPGQLNIFSLLKDGSKYRHLRNGGGIGQATAGASIPSIASDFRIGQAEDDFYLNGDVAEVIVFDHALSFAERKSVEAYLAEKYGLTMSGDSDGDGMSDEYELEYGLDPEADDLMEDFDSDGVPNQWEYAAGTAPNDAEDFTADWIVDPEHAGDSPSDNIVATIAIATGTAPVDNGNWGQSYKTIYIKSGVYAEQVVVPGDKRLALVGERGDDPVKVLGGAVDQPAVVVDGRGSLDSFWITRSEAAQQENSVTGAGVDLFWADGDQVRMANCIISHQNRGVSMMNSSLPELTIEHCTIINNREFGLAFFYVPTFFKMKSSILWNPGAGEILSLFPGGPDLEGNIVKGGEFGGTNSNPLLTASGKLSSTSPAIDAAADSVLALDFQGEIRPVGSARDLGADEWVDSDEDDLPDIWETKWWGNLASDGDDDPDGDRLTNRYEYLFEVDPLSDDTDDDGRDDLFEALSTPELSTYPAEWSLDTDKDGLSDGWEHFWQTDKTLIDTNGDGIPDHTAVLANISPTSLDVDGDGINNDVEIAMGINPFLADSDRDGVDDDVDWYPTDPALWDAPEENPADTTGPVLTLTQPDGVVVTP